MNLSPEQITRDVQIAVELYRERNQVGGRDVHVMLPDWAVPLVGPIDGAVIQPYVDDHPEFTVLERDDLRLYLHAGFTGPRPGDFDGTLDLGIIR